MNLAHLIFHVLVSKTKENTLQRQPYKIWMKLTQIVRFWLTETYMKAFRKHKKTILKIYAFLAWKWYHSLITLRPYFISILGRSKTCPNERISISLHGYMKRLLTGFALLRWLPLPVPMHWRSSHYAVTHVHNKNSNIQGRLPNVVKVIFHTIRNCS